MRGYRILIIDNDEAAREVMAEYLGLSGFDVLQAPDGETGIELMEAVPPDLVLMDVRLPGLDGFGTMQKMQKKPALRDVPVIFATGLDGHSLKVKGFEMGAEDYVVRPYNKAELLARIRAALRRAERYRRDDTGAGGNLRDLSIADLLQTFELGRKTATIRMREIDAEVVVESGLLVYARRGAFTGTEAFRRIFLVERGTFAVDFNPLPEDMVREPMPVQRVMMEAVTFVDELRNIFSAMPGENPVVELAAEGTGVAAIDRYRELTPMPLYDLAAAADGDMKGNAEALVGAYRAGRLGVVEVPRG